MPDDKCPYISILYDICKGCLWDCYYLNILHEKWNKRLVTTKNYFYQSFKNAEVIVSYFNLKHLCLIK